MTKILSLIVPAFMLVAATAYSPDADAAVRVVVTAAPRILPSARVWVPAHFEIKAGKRVRVHGHYKIAVPAKATWIPARWEIVRGKKVWIVGHRR